MSRKQLPQIVKRRTRTNPARRRGKKLRNSKCRRSGPRKWGSGQRRRPRRAKTLAKIALRKYFTNHKYSFAGLPE